VLGRRTLNKDSLVDLYGTVQPLDGALRIQQGRLRNTWLATLMCEPIPLAAILHAAGLQSARTLSELAAYLPALAVDSAPKSLRGAA